MLHSSLDIDTDQAVGHLMRFLSIEGVTGQEAAIGKAVVQALAEGGTPRRAIHFDRAHERIPLPTQTGNLIVTLPGSRPGPRRLLMTHLDTVPLCAGARPVRKGKRIVAAGPTALGGDNRTGVACLVTIAAMLHERQLPHPPLTFLFTVREESGLWGARHVDPAELGNPAEGFNVDGRSASEITIGAVGAERWQAEVFGRAAHAGVHPQQGISATLVASLALTQAYRDGWFGKIAQKKGPARSLQKGSPSFFEGTANIGSFGGQDDRSAGIATNVVTDYALIRGEARSHDSRFVRTITNAYRDAFQAAAKQVCDDRGRCARVRFQTRRDYYPFRLKANAPVVRLAQSAAERVGLKPTLRLTNGGLDANWLVRRGVPTVTFGAGQNNVHTVDEYVDVAEFANGCRMALALATLEE